MKKFLILAALSLGFFSSHAQVVVDNFNVGPYEVDYTDQGDVKYRLRDNINLYEYFDLQRDTIMLATAVEPAPITQAIIVSAFMGANRSNPFEIGIEGLWKQQVATDLYFNGGVSLTMGQGFYGQLKLNRDMLEIGVPLQLELGKLNHQKGSLYGLVSVAPTYYSNKADTDIVITKKGDESDGGAPVKETVHIGTKSGFTLTTLGEIGGNVPVGPVVARIGIYAKFKINCTPGDYDVYTTGGLGRMFLGAKIGVVL